MSYIFDALQRSETERSGVELNAFDLPIELLQMTESVALPAEPIKDFAAPLPTSPHREEEMAFLKNQVPTSTVSFPQFQSLPFSLPPNSKLVSAMEKESLAAEKFRFLAVRLRQLRQKRQLKRLLITSTIPEEGKSTVATNLACTLASRREQKVLLLEGDLRRPTVQQRFGLSSLPGLTAYLQNSISVEQAIYRLDAVGIWVLPAGSIAPNPLELLQGPQLGILMGKLDTWFDWIVIDSPPILPLADTSVLTRVADGALLVTRAGVTDKEQLKRGVEAIESSKLLGALINGSVNAVHNDYYKRYSPDALP
jgi:capsular exopolysaccharide synthesis family protein